MNGFKLPLDGSGKPFPALCPMTTVTIDADELYTPSEDATEIIRVTAVADANIIVGIDPDPGEDTVVGMFLEAGKSEYLKLPSGYKIFVQGASVSITEMF